MPSEMAINIAPKKHFPGSCETGRLGYIPSHSVHPELQGLESKDLQHLPAAQSLQSGLEGILPSTLPLRYFSSLSHFLPISEKGRTCRD